MNIKDILKQNDEEMEGISEWPWKGGCISSLHLQEVFSKEVNFNKGVATGWGTNKDFLSNTVFIASSPQIRHDLAEFARDALFIIEEMLHGLCDDYQLKQFKKKWGLE